MHLCWCHQLIFQKWFEEVRSVKNDLFIFAETYDYRRPKNYKDYLNAGFNGNIKFLSTGSTQGKHLQKVTQPI
jgi:hypothetical protein